MADVLIKILTPAEHWGFLTPEQARLSMQLMAGDAGSSDEYLAELIDQNSDVISNLCGRVFAREEVRETWRCLGEPCDCSDAANSRRLFLSHFPVKEEEIESVESPRGRIINPRNYELDERAGRLSIFGYVGEPIVVTYWGGYELPEEAPPALRWATLVLSSDARATAQRESSSIAASGIKSIAHKESRVTFETGGIKSEAGSTGGGSGTPAMKAIENLLIRYQRLWM